MRRWSLTFAALATLVAVPLIFARPSLPPELSTRHLLDATGALKAGERLAQPVAFAAGRVYSVSVALDRPGQLDPEAVVRVSVADAQRELVSKPLHVGDSDLYVLVRPAEGQGRVVLVGERGKSEEIGFTATVREWTSEEPGQDPRPTVETEPNNTPQEATPFALGQTVFATNDDRDFIAPLSLADRYPQPAELRRPPGSGPERGVDWYRFEHEGAPQLVHFQLDFLDREVPCDLLIYQSDGVEHKDGADPVSEPHEVQALPGNKFTTRVIAPGTYFVKVTANHPVYQFRTYMYEVPPYTSDPLAEAGRKSVRAGVDFAVGAGDSWHANTPRSGGVTTRVASTHNETQQCIACHPTHFPTRAQQVAVENGYSVNQRAGLQFLTARLYNSPRPFYGHKGATWTRMISSSANVMSRLGYLLSLHERNVSRESRTACLDGVAGYLKVYYQGRTDLPADESNGNTPLVSAYEVAGHSWFVFDELSRRVGLPARRNEYAAQRDQLRRLLEQNRLKDLRDLCYQTIAFVWIDKAAYAERIKANCERILKLQRESGQWAMTFNANAPEAEFQTGHCLYTLALAGYPAQHPQLTKAARYLLARQQPFGGWFDPQQSYENFKTPFRETQFAVMALSQLFPKKEAGGGRQEAADRSRWSQESQPTKLKLDEPITALAQLDQVWDTPTSELMQQLLASAQHDEPLLRSAACEALGRVGEAEAVPMLVAALGDRLKVVRHSAAWALREVASRKHVGLDAIARALRSDDDYTRRGAVRVFTQHFSYLTTKEKAQSEAPSISSHCLNLSHALNEPDLFVRLYAAKALSQWFYWTDDKDTQTRIADLLLRRMAENDHPWAKRAVLENFYSICDDNVRYLYRNWVPLLAKQADRDRVTVDHHGLMDMLARKISAALTSGNATLRDNLLTALTQHQLRRSSDRQSYGDLIQTPAGLYSRIGNDVEQIKFYEESTPALEPALMQLIDNPATRETALIATFMLRDTANLERLPLKMADFIATDKNARERETAWEYYRFLPVVVTDENRARWTARVSDMLTGNLEARKTAFDTLARAGAKFEHDPKVVAAVIEFVQSESARSWGAELMPAFAASPRLQAMAEIQDFVQQTLRSNDDLAVRGAVQLILGSRTLQADTATRATLLGQLRGEEPRARRVTLELVNRSSLLGSHVIVASVVADALAEPALRSAAVAAVEKSKALEANPAVQAALRTIAELSGKLPDLQPRTLDFDFFRERVQPLFFQPAQRDKRACIECHFNHTLLQVRRPLTVADARTNYLSALKVVNLNDPERSLLLTKPLADASTEGQVGATKVSHGGDRRWPTGEKSREYQTILAWINGAKANAGR